MPILDLNLVRLLGGGPAVSHQAEHPGGRVLGGLGRTLNSDLQSLAGKH